jgi:hypothetical protein
MVAAAAAAAVVVVKVVVEPCPHHASLTGAATRVL